MAIKLPALTFSKRFTIRSFHIQTDNKTGLTYLLKMGSTASIETSLLSKEIWQYLIQNRSRLLQSIYPDPWTGKRTGNQEIQWKVQNGNWTQKCLQKTCQRFSQLWPVCESPVVPSEKILFIEAGPSLPGSGCVSTGLVKVPNISCIPSFCSSVQGIKEGQTIMDHVQKMVLITSDWKSQNWNYSDSP